MLAGLFETIMVGVDGDAVSQPAFDKALMLAQVTQAKLLIVHVLSSTDADNPQPAYGYAALDAITVSAVLQDQYAQAWTNYRRRYEQLLAQKVEMAKSLGVKAESIQADGMAGTALCKLARQHGVDLLVVGSHRRRGLSELLVGSTSNYITHHAPCSVLVVYPALEDAQGAEPLTVEKETASIGV
ncbi:MAG: universal stress protein [Phormidesmis sp.]